MTFAASEPAFVWASELPGAVVILPPLLAVVVALWKKNALLALSSGVVLGAWLVHGPNPVTALARAIDTHIPATIANPTRASMLVFTMALGGMVGVLAKSGSTRALVDSAARHASNRTAGMVTTWVGGLLIFFDDYANCLLVGSTMRPLTDRLRISREKLAYLLDSTAAPLATIAPVSTWIGFQLGLLEPICRAPEMKASIGPYELFLQTIPYSFYSILTLGFVFLIARTGRDFGPMHEAEERACQTGLVVRKAGQPLVGSEMDQLRPASGRIARAWVALLPLLGLLLFVVVGLYASGSGHVAAGASLREVLGQAETTKVLLWAAFAGGALAWLSAVASGNLRASEAVEAWMSGAKSMVTATFILTLAWALGSLCTDFLGTGAWVAAHVRPSVHFLPALTFLLSGIIAFATGSSFSTMAIMFPIAGPMVLQLTGPEVDLAAEGFATSLRLATLGAVLSGAVFGDHCSPISDTTLLSSMGAGSDHVDHVRTQLPYALVCAAVAAVLGYLPAGWGLDPGYCLALGMTVLGVLVFVLGRVPCGGSPPVLGGPAPQGESGVSEGAAQAPQPS